MSIAILASLITYLYLQWPIFTSMILWATNITVIITGIIFVLYLYYSDLDSKQAGWTASRETNKEKFEAAWNATHDALLKKWKIMRVVAIIMLVFNTLIPTQKTVGTAVAVGAATYVTHEVISSEVVQKFLKLVTIQANSFLDERIRMATEAVNSEQAASK